MAKKFVRGVTGVDDIESFDKTLTNVNDLISDGQNTYVHTKKGKNELYYKITDSVNQVQSGDDTLTITKKNDTVTIANNTLATKQELETKQNTLTAGDGINLNNNTISVIHTKQSTVDCNNIITTQYLKTGDNTINLPQGSNPYGILSVVRIDDIVQQSYQDFYMGSGRYIRIGNNAHISTEWFPWEKIVTEPKT